MQSQNGTGGSEWIQGRIPKKIIQTCTISCLKGETLIDCIVVIKMLD